mgnify:CR=1 FL=1
MQRHITLKQFRYFLAVSETASVAGAARMINIAQSAVTKSIQELEESLGVFLFERNSRGMVLTQEGHRFRASARKVMAAHPYYTGFVDFGDAESYKQELERLRNELAQINPTSE